MRPVSATEVKERRQFLKLLYVTYPHLSLSGTSYMAVPAFTKTGKQGIESFFRENVPNTWEKSTLTPSYFGYANIIRRIETLVQDNWQS